MLKLSAKQLSYFLFFKKFNKFYYNIRKIVYPLLQYFLYMK
jgi:hypothetical protein